MKSPETSTSSPLMSKAPQGSTTSSWPFEGAALADRLLPITKPRKA